MPELLGTPDRRPVGPRRTARTAVATGIVAGVAAMTVGVLSFLSSTTSDPDAAWADSSRVQETVAADVRRTAPAVSRDDAERGELVPVTLSLDGVEQETTTQALTVRDLLVSHDVVLDDREVSHDLDAPVVAGMRVVVAKVEWADDTAETTLPHETREVPDATLADGVREVRTEGEDGLAVTTFLVSKIDGVEVSRSEVVSIVLRDAVDEVVHVGTRKAPTSRPTTKPSSTPAPAATTAPPEQTATPTATPEPTTSPEPTQTPEPAPTPTPAPTKAPVATAAPSGTAGTTPASAKALAKTMAAERGWTGTEYTCLVNLWQKESGWRYQAANASSTARGIPQAIMSLHFGRDWRTSAAAERYLTTPSVQIAWGLSYIAGRYDAPCQAWAASQSKGWY